jgi:steroid 5-alpha reductase family enzyme
MFFWAGFPGVFIPRGYIMVSPIFTTLLLHWGSGVANLKKGQEERYGERQDYRDYCASTPLLLPFMKPFYKDRR